MPRWARKNLTRKRVNANEGVKVQVLKKYSQEIKKEKHKFLQIVYL